MKLHNSMYLRYDISSDIVWYIVSIVICCSNGISNVSGDRFV